MYSDVKTKLKKVVTKLHLYHTPILEYKGYVATVAICFNYIFI